MIAIRREVLEELLKDKEFSKKLEKAKSVKDIIRLIKAYSKKKGFKIAHLELQ